MKQEELAKNPPSSTFTSLLDTGAERPAGGVLGVVHYGTECDVSLASAGCPELRLNMTESVDDGFAEVWTTDRPTECGEYDGTLYSHDGEYLFCAALIDPARTYAPGTDHAYTRALEIMEQLDYQNCFRIWNFVHGINDYNAQGLEIYRDFCQGRAQAFERFGFADEQFPAGTGIGSLGGGIAFYLMANRSGGITPIENPLQLSAYHYPKRYGPKSPRFARATQLAATDRDQGQLYLSGTASIRGHQTLHRGDVEAQCRLTLENIAELIGAENLASHGLEGGHKLSDLRNIKVYVRHAEDVETVREICQEAFWPPVDIAYLTVPICRSDLLVEIEGIVP